MSCIIAKPRRLTKSSHFKAVFDHQQFVDNRFVRLYFSERLKDTPSIGVITTKKLGGAVVRNRARRRIKAMISKIEVDIYSHFDLIWIVKRSFSNTTSEVIEPEIFRLLKKVT
ncbi:ribonuclease P protein component [Candidatus Marinamargulisbacteria bacterium SCGC AAA071-K20]|nr:ribonuclease P protein component [Candidatus Marinamargulisbacteria bacterium SCGC AAA071-K20]